MTDNTTALKIDCLKPAEIKLTRNKNGFLTLALNGKKCGRVKLTRAFPYSLPFSYIGISDIDDKEIGVIKELSELDEESEKTAKDELAARYFSPELSEIVSIKEKMGSFYFEAKISGKEKNFTVRDISRNIRMSPDNSVLIFDVDGNRYVILDFEKLQKKTRRLLEPYLY